MNYWPRWIGSIQKKTSHLSLAEMGAYDRLLDHYYAHEAPLPSDLDRCCRVAGAVTKAEREAVARVLAEYFTLEDVGYVNARAASEIAEAKPKIDAARANGALGGRPRKAQKEPDKKPTGFPNGLPTGNPAQTQGESSTTTLLVPTEPKNPPTPRKRGTFDASAIDLPDWLPRADWVEWAKDRAARRKPITERGAVRQVAQLAEYRKAGHSPASVIAHSLAGGFQGLYPPPKVAVPVAVTTPTPADPMAEQRRAEDAAWRNRTPEQIEAAKAAKLAALSAVRRIA